MEQEVAFGRYIKHRATGRVVGPVVPVYPSDIPYGMPPPSQVVWRYLPLWKFEDMCTSSQLYFCRCDKLDDQLEGRPSRQGIHGTSLSDRAFAAAYPMGCDYQSTADAQEVTRYCTFLNCWHKNPHEDSRMWREYTENDPDSVVITSSVKALHRVVPPKVKISNVKYISEDFPRTSLGSMTLFFFKDRSFSYERELRMGFQEECIYLDRKEDFGRRIEVNLALLVHRVILNKGISKAARERVVDLTRQYCRRAIVQDSVL